MEKEANNMRKTKIYGHRGSKGDYPENTMLGFKKALEEGVDGIELDVHLTKDDELVVIHDDTLDRTTNGTGFIRDYTLAELKRLSAGSKFQSFPRYEKDWENETIPTLEEVLQLFAPYDIELNIELKTYNIKYEGIEAKTVEAVKQWGNGRKVVYSSFHLPTLVRLKNISKEADIAWLLGHNLSLPEDYLSALNLESFHLGKKLLLEDGEQWKQVRELVRVWTVNQEDEIEQLLEQGVAAIITDYPARAISIRKERGVLVD